MRLDWGLQLAGRLHNNPLSHCSSIVISMDKTKVTTCLFSSQNAKEKTTQEIKHPLYWCGMDENCQSPSATKCMQQSKRQTLIQTAESFSDFSAHLRGVTEGPSLP